MAKTTTAKAPKKAKKAAKAVKAVAKGCSQGRQEKKAGREDRGAADALWKLAEHPMVGELLAIGATARRSLPSRKGRARARKSRFEPGRQGAGKAAAAAIGARLISEFSRRAQGRQEEGHKASQGGQGPQKRKPGAADVALRNQFPACGRRDRVAAMRLDRHPAALGEPACLCHAAATADPDPPHRAGRRRRGRTDGRRGGRPPTSPASTLARRRQGRSILASIAFSAARSVSTNVACAAPRDRASSPRLRCRHRGPPPEAPRSCRGGWRASRTASRASGRRSAGSTCPPARPASGRATPRR